MNTVELTNLAKILAGSIAAVFGFFFYFTRAGSGRLHMVRIKLDKF